MSDDMLFPTFYHINDYMEEGYAALPNYVATSYPLVLWSPSGRLLEQCYNDKNNVCSISPAQFIQLIEANRIQIIGREEWFKKNKRNEHRWEGAHWVDGFDDAVLAILKERETAPLAQRSVRIVPPEDGYDWARKYLQGEHQSTIDDIERLIKEHRVPEGVREKATSELATNKYEAVKTVLRDLRNHIEAKKLAGAKVPFLSQNDADFFRLMEMGGTIKEVKKEIVRDADMGRAIMTLVERLTDPQKVTSLTGYVGSDMHQELATWFSKATDVANTFLPRDFSEDLEKTLREHAMRGRLSPALTRRLRQHIPIFAPEAETDTVITWLIRQVIDPDDTLGISNVEVGDIMLDSGFSREVEMVSKDDLRNFWPLLSPHKEQPALSAR